MKYLKLWFSFSPGSPFNETPAVRPKGNTLAGVYRVNVIISLKTLSSILTHFLAINKIEKVDGSN